MNEEKHSVGASLRAAREAQGLSIPDAAHHLRLMNRQIEAIEAEDFSSLGQPVFARGFVRNYARLLGLDQEALLRAMGVENVGPIEVVQSQAVVLSGSWLSSRWLIFGIMGLLILVAVPIALYVWLNSGEEELKPPHAPITQRSTPAVAPVTVEKTVEIPVGIPVAEVSTAVDINDTAPASEAADAALPTAKSELHFEFAEDAWVEVKDGTGQVLHRQMGTKGSSLEVSGQPPFNLLVRNAAQVRMTYNGRPLDLKPFIDVTDARFNLEE